MTRQEFAEKVNSMIPASSKILHSVTIAQAVVDSSDSQGNVANSSLTKVGNALFGIKVHNGWTGKVLTCNTFEILENKERWEGPLPFRAYDSWQESVENYVHYMQDESNRYANVIGNNDFVACCYNLKADGYATAPNYAETLISIIKSLNLTKYDNQTVNAPAPQALKSTEEICSEVLSGAWGNGADRERKLTAAGYNYATIQAAVNAKVNITPAAQPTITVGSKVRVKQGAKDLNTHGTLAGFVYAGTYLVRQITGQRAVIAPQMSGAVTAVVNINDLVGV